MNPRFCKPRVLIGKVWVEGDRNPWDLQNLTFEGFHQLYIFKSQTKIVIAVGLEVRYNICMYISKSNRYTV